MIAYHFACLKAFLLGMFEFRSSCTANLWHGEYDLVETYDSGRDWMHALTLRYWDEA